MSNSYKNAFYAPTGTSAEIIYTCPAQTTTIFQTLQLTNISGNKNVTVSITDQSAGPLNYIISYMEMSGPTISNLLKGSIVLEEGDELNIATSVTSGISGTASLLETTRVYIAETGGPS